MSILYRLRERLNPQNRTAPAKLFAIAVARGTVDIDQLLDAVCEGTTLNRDEARMGINRLFKKTEEFLGMGFSVNLGDLGYIHVTLKSNGVDTPEEASASMITDIVPHFVFGRKLRERLKNIKVERDSK